MASKVQKVIIPNRDLPAMNADTGSYFFRYRIVSEDKNQTSHWSPVQEYVATDLTPLTADDYVIHKVPEVDSVTITWNKPSLLVNVDSDIYVRWANSDIYQLETEPNALTVYPWYHATRISGSTHSILIPNTITKHGLNGAADTQVAPKHLTVAVQVPTYPQKRILDPVIEVKATILKTPQINV